MQIRNILHKGLRRLYEDDSARAIPAATAGKLRSMLAVLDDLENVQELQSLQAWKAHQLSGDRKGTWSLFVTRNWRLTFSLDETAQAICDLDLEDYH